MREIPEIVKILREAESLGRLTTSSMGSYQLEEVDKPIEDNNDDPIDFFENSLKFAENIEVKDIEEKYQKIFENYSLAITIVDEKERIISWNKYAEDLFGMKDNDLSLRNIKTLYPEKEWKKIRAKNLRKKGITHKFETKMRKKDGSVIDVEISICVLRKAHGQTYGSIGIIKDITDLRKTERELIESEKKYKTIFENSAVAITFIDENEKIVSWNKYTEKLLNMNKKDLQNKPIKSLYPKDEWKKIREENIREKGMQHHLETKMIRKNQGLLDVDISLSVLKDKHGNVTGSIGVIKDITDRKQTERWLNFIMEYAGDSIYLLDEDGRYLMANNELLLRLNRTSEEVIGNTFYKLHMPKENKEFKVKLKQVLKEKKTIIQEHKSISLNRWFLRTLSPIKDLTTNKTVIAVISKDITDWKYIQEKLKTSEEKYRTIFENSAVAITVTDEKERLISWNNYAEALLEMDSEDLKNKPIKSLYPADEWKKMRSENIRQKGMQHHFETKILKKDEAAIDVDISVSVIKNNNGQVTGSIGVIRDITDRKKTEKALKDSEEKFKQLYLKAPIAYHTLNPKGIIKEVNEKWCQVLNYKKEEVLGKSIFNFIPSCERETAKVSFINKIKSKKTFSKPNLRSYLTKEGHRKSLMINDFFSFDENNNIQSVHTTMEDITKFIEAENKLKEAHELLQIANKELDKKVKERTVEIEHLLKQKDEFISQLGHDLKTPLSIILNVLPMIKDEIKEKDVIEDCDVAIRNTNYIKSLVTETLQIAKLSSPNIKFKKDKINLNKLVSNIFNNKPYLVEEKNIKFKNNVDKKITVIGDDLRLQELLNNLITNSAKFTPNNGTISVNAKKNKNKVTVTITDTGIGLTKNQIAHIFDEFYKVDESRHDINSCGLGLSICKRIVEKHDGKIWADSKGQGKGTEISFTLKQNKKK